jgi:hypothetical protein
LLNVIDLHTQNPNLKNGQKGTSMPTTNLRKKTTIEILINELRSYGLNPYEWHVERENSRRAGTILFRHRTHSDLMLKGQIEKEPTGSPIKNLSLVLM